MCLLQIKHFYKKVLQNFAQAIIRAFLGIFQIKQSLIDISELDVHRMKKVPTRKDLINENSELGARPIQS